MTKRMIVSFSLALALFCAAALDSAAAPALGDTQAWTFVSSQKKLGESGIYGVDAHFVDLRALSSSMHVDYLYAGPLFALKVRGIDLLLSPQCVGAFNFFEGRQALGPSLWLTATKGKIGLFLEGEAYFGAQSRRAYYGYYAFDVRPAEWFNLGVQSEQTNKDLVYGPHLGFDKAILHLELQYYVSDGTQFFRLQSVFQF